MFKLEREGATKRSLKRVILYSSFLLTFIILLSTASAFAIGDTITGHAWLKSIADFLNLGTTWAQVIISIAVLAIIFSALYDILEFTAFESKWVKTIIALSIALITAVSGGLILIAGAIFQLVGGATVLGIAIVIVAAIVFFVIASFLTGKVKILVARRKAMIDSARAIRGRNQITQGAKTLAGVGNVATNAGRENRDNPY